jgi:5-aminopentanamidase
MKIAVYQGPSPQGDVSLAMSQVETTLAAVAMAGAQMVVFPELFLPGYNQSHLLQSTAQPQGGPWERQFSKLAEKYGCGITIGWAEESDGKTYNAASCFDGKGRKLTHYRKQQLFGPIEKANFSTGDAHAIFDFMEFKAAILICYDVEFAHCVSALQKEGVNLLLVPTANPKKYNNVPNILVPARALENRMTIAYANYCGTEAGLSYGGKSVIVGPDAEVLAQAGIGETILLTDISVIHQIDPALLSTQLEDTNFAKATTLSPSRV